eukprot:maker-scaffold353_size198981-snap-gene-0.38 protein:Tk05254 transcript:maker-scaffold353_size198981-snap-gene-0.38-mRNA-1 annotation:"hypothetical protein DAPPUDRAFT_319971"
MDETLQGAMQDAQIRSQRLVQVIPPLNKIQVTRHQIVQEPKAPQILILDIWTNKDHGFEQHWKAIQAKREKYIPPDIDIMRLEAKSMNPEGDGRVLLVFDPEDIKRVFANEGPYPNRGPGMEALTLMRHRKPDVFKDTVGVFFEEGPRWKEFRSNVQQDMMRPKSAMFYIDPLMEVGEDFVIKLKRDCLPNGTNPGDFLEYAHLFAFEAISVIALDARMGVLKETLDPYTAESLEFGQKFLTGFPDLLMSLPFWRFLPPRLHPAFRKLEDNFRPFVDFINQCVEEAKDRVRAKVESGLSEDPSQERSILEKLIIKNGFDSPIPTVMAMDMLGAGIDTTGNTIAFFVYHMAKNQEAQEKLREEVLALGNEITETKLGKMTYFRACLKESFRVTPVISGGSRVIPNDMELKGFHIPKDTMFFWQSYILSNHKDSFPDNEVFRPERWIDPVEKKAIHPFASLPFSHGPRMCVGKRFAELEIQICMIKLLKNFQIEWRGDVERVDYKWKLLNVPTHELRFQFKPLLQLLPYAYYPWEVSPIAWNKRGASPGDLEVEEFLPLAPIPGPDAIAAQELSPDEEYQAIQRFFMSKRVQTPGFKCSSNKVWSRHLRKGHGYPTIQEVGFGVAQEHSSGVTTIAYARDGDAVRVHDLEVIHNVAKSANLIPNLRLAE